MDWTPGLVPLGTVRDSVQIPIIFTSLAAIWNLFMQKTLFEASSNKSKKVLPNNARMNINFNYEHCLRIKTHPFR